MLIYWLFLITLVKCIELERDNLEAIYSIAREELQENSERFVAAEIGPHSVNAMAVNKDVPSLEGNELAPEDIPDPVITFDNATSNPYLDIKYIPGQEEGTKDNATNDDDVINPEIDHVGTAQDQSTTTTTKPPPVIKTTQLIAKINIQPRSLQVLEGENAQFNCSVMTSSDMAYIGWIKNNKDMLYDALLGPKRYVSFGFQNGQGKRDKQQMKTFWDALTLYHVTPTDEGVYTCYEDNAKLVQNVQLTVVTEEDILKKACVYNVDCWKSDFQCIDYACVKQLPDYDVTSDSEKPQELDTTSSYAYGLRFLITAFICGGIVITIVTFFLLSRIMCRRVMNNSRRRRNTLAREQLVYIIGRTDSGIVVPPADKPPTYEVCLQSSIAAATPSTKDETPPPSYRQHKTRVIPSLIPPPPYDVNNTSSQTDASAASAMPAESTQEATSTTTSVTSPKTSC